MLIGIAGKARSGKDTFAEFLLKEFEPHGDNFIRMAFADALKSLCMESFGLTREQLYGNQKELEDKRYCKQDIKPYCSGLGKDELPSPYWTPREIMQAVGSFYRSIDYDYWVKQLDKAVKASEIKNVIITDIRHVNECKYIKENNGLLIRVLRDDIEEIHGMTHESETALNDYKNFDIEIFNNGDLADLNVAARNITKAVKLLEEKIVKGETYNG